MIDAFLRRARFALERWVQRGAVHQLLLMAGLVVLVAVAGGLAAFLLTPGFDDAPTAVWWSFLRLTDPGYLGDDEGTALRVVSTIVTVLGYVLFMGSLIAILTQWLSRTIRNLESGLTPIAMADHFVILGWTNRTPEIIKKLLAAGGRLERFLAARGGARKLRIVVLAEDMDAERRQSLRDDLGDTWNEGQVFLRSGSSLQLEHLERLDLLRAAVVIVPGADFELGGAELTDTRVVKTLLTVDTLFRQHPGKDKPHVVAELFDPRKVSIARSTVASGVEVIAGDRLVSRLLTQGLRQPGVATILLSLLTHREGNAIYLRSFPELEGESLRSLAQAFPTALVLGLVSTRDKETHVQLDPTVDVTIASGDLLILLAKRYDDCVIGATGARAVPAAVRALQEDTRPTGRRRLLILGWSHKVPILLEELASASSGTIEVTIMSRVDTDERERALARMNYGERLTIENVHGDYSLEQDLEQVEPGTFDHVAFLASGWMGSSEQADARTVLGVLLLHSLLREQGVRPEVLVELLDPENARILAEVADVVFVSPRVLSHLLAHVGLRPELNAVFDALICAGGTDIELRSGEALELAGRSVTFADVQRAASAHGCVGLGFFVARSTEAPEVHLNPPRDQVWNLGDSDRIVLLTRDRQA